MHKLIYSLFVNFVLLLRIIKNDIGQVNSTNTNYIKIYNFNCK